MPQEKNSRSRMVRVAGRLFQRQGYSGTGLRQILQESGAPRGSLYFHFPGGKEQLGAEAAASAGRQLTRLITAILSSHDDPAEAVRAFARASAAVLEASEYAEGCPIATMTLEAAHTSEAIRAACAANYTDWQRLLGDYLIAHGVEPARASELGLAVLAVVEGGLILCRAERSAAPLQRLADLVADLVAKELAAEEPAPPETGGRARARKAKPARR